MALLFFTLLIAALITLIGNYVGVFGDTANWRLWYGLALMAGSFVVATQLY